MNIKQRLLVAELRVPLVKFYVSVCEERTGVNFMMPLKRAGEENTLELMVQGTDVLFAYWRLSSRYVNIFSRTLGVSSEIKPVGCLYKISGGRKETFLQLENIKKESCCYFKELERGYSYQFSLGFYWNYKFIVLLQSQAIAIPAGGIPFKKRAEVFKEITSEEYSFS